MVTYSSRGRLVLVIEMDVDDLSRSMSYTQRRLHAMQSEPAKGHWWPRFLRWWCGVDNTTKED
jgi:hypothetical protein